MTMIKRIDIRVPYADRAAQVSDKAHEQLAYTQSLVDAHHAANMTPGADDRDYTSNDVHDRISECLHHGKLDNDWLITDLDGYVLTVEYGDHDPVHIDASPIDNAGSLATRVLDNLSEQAINRLATITTNTLR